MEERQELARLAIEKSKSQAETEDIFKEIKELLAAARKDLKEMYENV